MSKRLLFMVMMLTSVLTLMAQVTTSALSGKVTMADTKEEVIGATIQAIHEPSGTKYAAVTNANGRFTIQGMRNGGRTVLPSATSAMKRRLSVISYSNWVRPITSMHCSLRMRTNLPRSLSAEKPRSLLLKRQVLLPISTSVPSRNCLPSTAPSATWLSCRHTTEARTASAV